MYTKRTTFYHLGAHFYKELAFHTQRVRVQFYDNTTFYKFQKYFLDHLNRGRFEL